MRYASIYLYSKYITTTNLSIESYKINQFKNKKTQSLILQTNINGVEKESSIKRNLMAAELAALKIKHDTSLNIKVQ